MAASSATLHLYMVIRPEAMESKETGMAAEAQGSQMHSQALHPGTGNRRAHIDSRMLLAEPRMLAVKWVVVRWVMYLFQPPDCQSTHWPSATWRC